MTERPPAIRALSPFVWPLWGLVMALFAGSLVLRFLNGSANTASLEGTEYLAEIFWWDVLIPAAIPAYATVGAVVASRRPKNAVGWLCLAEGGLIAVVEVTWEYAARALDVAPGSLPAGQLAAWVANVTNFTMLLPFALVLLLFADGRLPSRRWRLVAWGAVAGAGLRMLSAALGPMVRNGQGPAVPSPTGVGGLVATGERVGMLLLLFMLLASVISVFLRWRVAQGEERQQLKWLAYVGAIVAVSGLGGIVSAFATGFSYPTFLFGSIATGGITVGVPVAIGVAVLRYRLYDVDFLINRTLVYGLLSASLVLVYLASVLVLQTALAALTGSDSGLVVVASTLAIAALFNPLRRAVQAFVDRRFYRGKYDAARTLEDFSARLRDETDLDGLDKDLLEVVEKTVRPAHASLWLRTSAGSTKTDT